MFNNFKKEEIIMSIEKKFFMVPPTIVAYVFTPKPGDRECFSCTINGYDGYTELAVDDKNSNSKHILGSMILHDIDTRMIKGIDNKEFSEDEMKKLSFIRTAFSIKAYNCMKSYKWYNAAFSRLVAAYDTMCILLKTKAIDINSKDWFDLFFKILIGFDFFGKFKEGYRGYYNAHRNAFELNDEIKSAGI